MDTVEISKILRSGVHRIISRATPPEDKDHVGKYCRSSHPHREFLFVISGESHYLCNDSVYPCTSGMLFLIDSGLPHGHRYIKEDHDLLHLWGYFDSQKLHVSVVEVTQGGQYRTVPELSFLYMPEEFSRILENRWNLLTQKEDPTEEIVEHYMKGPVNAVLEEAAFRLTEQETEKQKLTAMEEIKEYILSRNGRDCSLEHLAAISGYTRCYFARKFHETCGTTIGKYIEGIRIKYVQTALKHRIPQKEIAYELGFASPASFWNWLQSHKKTLKPLAPPEK